MKKPFLLLAVGLVTAIFVSCSSDDVTNDDVSNDNPEKESTKLPKSTVRTLVYPDGFVEKLDYIYDGTRIKSVASSPTSKKVYTYDAKNVLQKVETQENNVTVSYLEYVWDNGDVKSITEYLGSENSMTKNYMIEYTYDAGAKTQTDKTTIYTDGKASISPVVNVLTYDGKNLVKTVTSMIIDNANSSLITQVFSYDSKPLYHKNITSYPQSIAKETNNVVKIVTTNVTKVDNEVNTGTSEEIRKIDYDVSGYPTSITNYNGDILIGDIKITYTE